MDKAIYRTIGITALAALASGCVSTRRYPTYHGSPYPPTVVQPVAATAVTAGYTDTVVAQPGYVTEPVTVVQPT